MRVSENVRHIAPSGTLAIAALCRELRAQGRDVLDLGIGEPDFRTPEFIAQAGIASIEQGMTQYPPVAGIQPLRQAIARSIASRTGRTTNPAGVVVSSGAKQALFHACFTLFGRGDEVIIPAPYWTSYPELVKLARAEPRILPTEAADGFKVTPVQLEAAYSPRVRGLILNSPSNPTGAVYTLEELTAIYEWAKSHEVWIISDEIYSRICYSQPRAAGLLDVTDDLSRLVIVDGASKAFAMTGWRIGYSYTTPELAEQFTTLQGQITSGAAMPSQFAATAAYREEPQAELGVRAMERIFRMRRDLVLAQVAEHAPALECFRPEGAFYVFIRADRVYTAEAPDSAAFCRWLLEKTDVALVPGSAFGDDRYVRLSIAAPNATLSEAIRRIGMALSSA